MPGPLNALSGVLMYTDRSTVPHSIRAVCCKCTPPTNSPLGMIPTEQKNIYDMCITTLGDEQLLVTADPLVGRGKSVSAYSIRRKEVVWRLSSSEHSSVQPRRICTNDAMHSSGHIFVTNQANASVFVLSTSGKYLSTILKKGDFGMGKPDWVRWNNVEDCLVVTHGEKSEKQIISFFKVTLLNK